MKTINYTLKSLIGLLLIAVTFAPSASLAASEQYELLVDEYFSPYAGSTYFNSTYNFYKQLDDRYLPSSAGKTNASWILGRTAKFTFEYLLSSFFEVFQHEVFGHGYRAREFDFNPLSYQIGIASGTTYFSNYDFQRISEYQRNALVAGGLEANNILAQQTRAPWFESQKIDNRDAVLYVVNQLTAFNYVYITDKQDLDISEHYSNDINSYINGVNRYYGNNTTLSHNKMRAAILVDLLDPALLYSLYGIGNYIITGQQKTNLYMFDVYGYKYLPAAHTILAPYGLEFQLQNMIKTPKGEFAQINFRFGSNANINTFGIDFNVTPIYEYKNIHIGNKFSVWYQPKMIYANAASAKSGIGFAEFVSLESKLSKKFSVIADVGYKTSGYLPGFDLNNGIIFRLGCKW